MTTTWTHDSEQYRYSTRADLPDFVRMLSDPEVGRWLWFTPAPPERFETFFGPFLDQQTKALDEGRTPDSAVFTVQDTADSQFLGQGAVVAVDGSPGGYEIGFQLRQEAWGRGVGHRLGRFLCSYAIEIGDAHRIEAGCLEGNAASAGLLRKLGLALEGTRPGYRLKGTERHAELCFGRLVDELDRESLRALARQLGLSRS